MSKHNSQMITDPQEIASIVSALNNHHGLLGDRQFSPQDVEYVCRGEILDGYAMTLGYHVFLIGGGKLFVPGNLV